MVDGHQPSSPTQNGGEVDDGTGCKGLSEAHWKWLESLLYKLYVDTMIHSIKHGEEATNKEETKNDKSHQGYGVD